MRIGFHYSRQIKIPELIRVPDNYISASDIERETQVL